MHVNQGLGRSAPAAHSPHSRIPGRQVTGRWLTMTALCSIVLGLGAAAQADSLQIGTVLGIPVGAVQSFRLANQTMGLDIYGGRVPPNDVTVLHICPGSGLLGPNIATVSITQKGSGLKAWRVYFPLQSDGTLSPIYQQINGGDVFTNPRVLRAGSGGVVQVDVRQADTGNFELDRARFMLIPTSTLYRLQAENPKATLVPVHLQRMPYNSWGTWVQLVAVDLNSARGLKIPEEMIVQIRVLNSNVTVGTDARSTDGSRRLATVIVR